MGVRREHFVRRENLARVHASVIRFIFLSARYRRDRALPERQRWLMEEEEAAENISRDRASSGARRVYKSQNRSSERARCVILHVRNIYDAARSLKLPASLITTRRRASCKLEGDRSPRSDFSARYRSQWRFTNATIN